MWLYIPIYEILFSIPVIVIFFFLFNKFWQFRLLSATLGMILIASLPVISIYLAYISITEESLFPGIIVAVIQLVLGWTVCAIPLYICTKPYLNYVKECFEKTDIKEDPYPNEMKENFLSEKPLAKATEQAAKKILRKQDKENPYSTERRKDFLSEKSLADRLSNKLKELAKKNKK